MAKTARVLILALALWPDASARAASIDFGAAAAAEAWIMEQTLLHQAVWTPRRPVPRLTALTEHINAALFEGRFYASDPLIDPDCTAPASGEGRRDDVEQVKFVGRIAYRGKPGGDEIGQPVALPPPLEQYVYMVSARSQRFLWPPHVRLPASTTAMDSLTDPWGPDNETEALPLLELWFLAADCTGLPVPLLTEPLPDHVPGRLNLMNVRTQFPMAVPLPGGLWSMLLGLAAMAALAHRRIKRRIKRRSDRASHSHSSAPFFHS